MRPSLADRILDEAARLAAAGWDRVAESLLELAIDVERDGGRVKSRDGRRFGLSDIERTLSQVSTITRPLTEDEAAELKKRERELEIDGDHWDWGSDRRTVLSMARVEPESQCAYDAARRQVLGHIRAMNALFSMQLGQRVDDERRPPVRAGSINGDSAGDRRPTVCFAQHG